jgi:hypothetical protein
VTSKPVAILEHLVLASVTLALMVTGFVLVSTKADAFSTLAAAVTGPNLEISAAGGSVWSGSTGPAWTLTNAAPGDSVTGTVRLRTLEAAPARSALVLRAEAPDATPGFAEHLFITSMSLGGEDLRPSWGGCTGGGVLTLGDLAACPELTAALPVPSLDGEDFVMTIQLDPALGNAFQGASMGGVTFEFALRSPDSASPGGSASAGPGSGAPAATAASSVTPQPPTTGFGVFPEEQQHLAGYAMIGVGAFLAAVLLISLAARAGRRPPS